ARALAVRALAAWPRPAPPPAPGPSLAGVVVGIAPHPRGGGLVLARSRPPPGGALVERRLSRERALERRAGQLPAVPRMIGPDLRIADIRAAVTNKRQSDRQDREQT